MISSCSSNTSNLATNTPQLTIASTTLITDTLKPTSSPYIILLQPFVCGDGVTDISTNTSFNGLFKSNGFGQYQRKVVLV